jgi:hypothetical protein
VFRRRFFQSFDYFPKVLIVDGCLLIACMSVLKSAFFVIKLVTLQAAFRAKNPPFEAKIRGFMVLLPAS